jgi:hypothetical protein
MKGYIKSSPYFFRLIGYAMAMAIGGLLVLALIFPAPLQEPANLGIVPNPVKSAWFLLWIQELVSYSSLLIYPVIAGTLFFLLLPWLPVSSPAHKAKWFPRDQRTITTATIVVFLAIVTLTVVANFFRGENWSLIFPF